MWLVHVAWGPRSSNSTSRDCRLQRKREKIGGKRIWSRFMERRFSVPPNEESESDRGQSVPVSFGFVLSSFIPQILNPVQNRIRWLLSQSRRFRFVKIRNWSSSVRNQLWLIRLRVWSMRSGSTSVQWFEQKPWSDLKEVNRRNREDAIVTP